MIKGYCTTNLDEYQREIWPTRFVCVPNIGDRVYSKKGICLYVVSISHKQEWSDKRSFGSELKENEPYVIIELHKLSSVPRR